jgi:transposase
MTPTPAHPTRRYGLGAVNWHTGETVALTRRRPRRAEVAELLMALLEKHPRGRVYVAWDNASTHEDHEIEAVLRGAAGRLVLPYLPTDRPWLNPIEMLWRHFRREVTHGALFENVHALLRATTEFFARYNRTPERVRSIIGAHPARRLALSLALLRHISHVVRNARPGGRIHPLARLPPAVPTTGAIRPADLRLVSCHGRLTVQPLASMWRCSARVVVQRELRARRGWALTARAGRACCQRRRPARRPTAPAQAACPRSRGAWPPRGS